LTQLGGCDAPFALGNTIPPIWRSSRENCRAAQLAAIAEGRHASRFTRKSTGAETPQPEMNASEIRQKFNTLDKVVIEIERLQNPSNSSSAQSASKPATRAPSLEELSVPEIKTAMDIANRQKTVK